MLLFFHFQVATLQNRYEILPKIHDAVSSAGAWVTDFHKTSPSSVCLDLEVSAKDIPALHLALKALEVSVEPEHDAVLNLFSFQIANYPERCIPGTVTVRFLAPDHDLPPFH